MALGETWSKKSVLKFLVHGADIAGLTKLVDADLGGGLCHYNLELGITHDQV